MSRTLHRQLRTQQVTVPAGTLQAAPQTTAWDLGAVIVEWVEVMIPKGHAGLTGVHLDYQGVALVPFATPPEFLVARDETVRVPVDLEIGAPLSVVSYNLDVFSHSFYWRAFVNLHLTDALAVTTPDLLDLSAARA